MPGTPTPNYAIPTLDGSDLVRDIDTLVTGALEAIDETFVGYSSGPIGSRPPSTLGSPGVAGREYRATDAGGERYRDVGTGWEEVAHGRWVPVAQRAGTITDALSASPGILTPEGGTVTPDVDGEHATILLGPTLFPVEGRTVTYRIVARGSVNTVNPGTSRELTLAAKPATAAVGSSGQPNFLSALSADPTSGAVTSSALAAGTSFMLTGPEFSNPGLGDENMMIVASLDSDLAANSRVTVVAQLQMRSVKA